MNEKEIKKELVSLGRIKELLLEKLTEQETNEIFISCERRIREAWVKYDGISNEEAYHLKKIIPVACMYLAIKDKHPDMAMDIILQNHREKTDKAARALQKAMKLPGMRKLFLKVWDPMTRKMFGEKAGFRNVFYENQKNEYRMDILGCPYCRVFTELGTPELAQYSCESDDIVYGNLPGIDFIRTQTLAKGGTKCDFYLRLSNK